jgi:2-polyprenyl-3-methyl-5-hydroxy-6-metoxy-1,4-benzoquinol methylase
VIEHWSEGIADQNMAEEILVDLGETICRHPWWQARAALTLELLKSLHVAPPARILDAGCGWGVTLSALEQRGFRATGMDVSRRTLEQLDRPGRTLVEADLTRPISRDVELFDAVLALDVIEHLDDDQAAVARLTSLTRPGGVVIVSVPALPEMYTEFDRIQGHRRRYMPETLRAAFCGSGLVIEQVFWWGQWLVPALRRQRGDIRFDPNESPSQIYRHYLGLPPWPLPWLARMAFRYEQRKAIAGRLRTGTSLFAVARRPALLTDPIDVGSGFEGGKIAPS